jgi:hypothetical protein
MPVRTFALVVARGLYLAGVAFYAVSFALPTAEFGACGRYAKVPGLAAFLAVAGAFKVPSPDGYPRGFMVLVWLANPIFAVGAVVFLLGRRPLISACMGVIALGLGLAYLHMPLYIGYHVWLGSFGLLAVAGVVGRLCGDNFTRPWLASLDESSRPPAESLEEPHGIH